MNKKIFTSILLFVALFLCFNICFASDNTNLGTEVQDSIDKSKDSVQNAGNGIMNMTEDAGNGVENMAESVGNKIKDMGQGITSSMQNMFDDGNVNNSVTNDNNNNAYTAARTSADMAANGMTNTAWIWLILGVTGIVIIALTWYYVTQSNDRH